MKVTVYATLNEILANNSKTLFCKYFCNTCYSERFNGIATLLLLSSEPPSAALTPVRSEIILHVANTSVCSLPPFSN